MRHFILTIIFALIIPGNDSDCSPDKHIYLSHNAPFILFSPGFPNTRMSHLDCSWIATAPYDANVMLKFRVLDFQPDMEVLAIGRGDDPNNRASVLMKSWEAETHVPPSPLFTGARVAWIRFATNWPWSNKYRGFSLEIWATSATGINRTIAESILIKPNVKIVKIMVDMMWSNYMPIKMTIGILYLC